MGFTSKCAIKPIFQPTRRLKQKPTASVEERATRINAGCLRKQGKDPRSELREYDEEKAKRYYSDCGPCSSKRKGKKVKFVCKMVNTILSAEMGCTSKCGG
jgi:hypothetical protein